MVTRKPSVPLSAGSTSGSATQANRNVNSTDSPRSPRAMTTDSPYGDMGNPWQDEATPQQARAPETPLNAPEFSSEKPSTSSSNVLESGAPDILKPGWSGQNTPRSSMDSDRSKDFWESSDEEEGENSKEKKPTLFVANGTEATVQKEGTKASSPGSELPVSLQIKRKPISPSLIQEETPPSLPALDFASNNPFRQQSNDEFRNHDYSFDRPDKELKGKGKESGDISGLSISQFDSLRIGRPMQTSTQNSSSGSNTFSPWSSGPDIIPPPPSAPPPPAPLQAPPPVPEPLSPYSKQPPLIPVSALSHDIHDPWAQTFDSRLSSSNAFSAQHSGQEDKFASRESQPELIPTTEEWKPLPDYRSLTPSKVPTPQPSPLPSQKAEYTEKLLDRGDHKAPISLDDELKALPNHAPSANLRPSLSLLGESSLPQQPSFMPIHQEDSSLYSPPSGAPPSHQKQDIYEDGLPPVKPPRSAPVSRPLTEAELAQMQEQRNETYQIKHFRWFDHRTRKLRSSSMLTQNQNGPCPLLALVNAMILSAQDQDQAVLDNFLSTREQVTLGTIIENLMMELLYSNGGGDMPDVDELNRFLMKLRTGMNMNPRLVTPPAPAPNLMDQRNSMLHIVTPQQQDKPGSFEPTADFELYNAFHIQTVHGWLPEPGTDAASAFQRSAQNYEDAQAKLFGEDELEYKLSRNGLTPEEQVVWEDIVSMKNFLSANPTQLTQYGLHCIQASMDPGSFAILFRNDHFSTIYKHPRDGQLYTLLTDAGFAERDEIIWESLVDVSGQYSEFFSGDFKSVSHNGRQAPSSMHHQRVDTPLGGSQDAEPSTPLSPVQRQEQEDADLAMAMQLQEEEEQQQRQRERAASQSQTQSQSQTNQASGTPGQARNGQRRSTGNIPITLSSARGNSSQEVRPLIPPRNSRSNVTAVNRPSDNNAADAPPAYEEAARGKPYNPPIGSPLHPHSSPTTETGRADTTSSIDHTQASGTMARPSGPSSRQSRTASAAYNDNHGRFYADAPSPAYDFTDGRMPGSYIHTGHGGHGQSANAGGYNFPPTLQPQPQYGRQRERDRDCIVM